MEVERDVAKESTYDKMINDGSTYHQGPANRGMAEELELVRAAVGL